MVVVAVLLLLLLLSCPQLRIDAGRQSLVGGTVVGGRAIGGRDAVLLRGGALAMIPGAPAVRRRARDGLHHLLGVLVHGARVRRQVRRRRRRRRRDRDGGGDGQVCFLLRRVGHVCGGQVTAVGHLVGSRGGHSGRADGRPL